MKEHTVIKLCWGTALLLIGIGLLAWGLNTDRSGINIIGWIFIILSFYAFNLPEDYGL